MSLLLSDFHHQTNDNLEVQIISITERKLQMQKFLFPEKKLINISSVFSGFNVS